MPKRFSSCFSFLCQSELAFLAFLTIGIHCVANKSFQSPFWKWTVKHPSPSFNLDCCKSKDPLVVPALSKTPLKSRAVCGKPPKFDEVFFLKSYSSLITSSRMWSVHADVQRWTGNGDVLFDYPVFFGVGVMFEQVRGKCFVSCQGAVSSQCWEDPSSSCCQIYS